MKFFTKRNVTQKMLIALIVVMLFNFIAPKRVKADGAEVGGILLSPIFALVAVILDNAQNLVEMAIIGEYSPIIKDNNPGNTGDPNSASVEIDVQSLSDKSLEFDGAVWNIGDYGIPVIQVTPEEIFSNKIPALDVNFISPSVEGDDERNVAKQLQGLIASWYVAIRTLALVGLLSVLVYIGIRMMLTSTVADRVKYKRMFMDWVIAMCLVFVLHYIMSFALTISESITSLIGNQNGQSIRVVVGDGTVFATNLMGFIRFMIQCTDIGIKCIYILLYVMLIIFNIRFIWIYLKRLINMAFLTVIAPMVALTYPIDKVSDGSAQAFNMWIKEFSYNALIQPMHLLLYTILCGSAAEIAVRNPLYAIACLGFIIAAEKLVKQMFGFNKAGATVGSIAGAAGVTAIASNGLMRLARGIGGRNGGQGGADRGKVRTNDRFNRQGGTGRNDGFDSFNRDGVQGLPDREGEGEGDVPAPEREEYRGNQENDNNNNNENAVAEGENQPGDANQQNESGRESLDDLEQQRAELYNQGYTDDTDEIRQINERIQNGDFEQSNPDVGDSPNPEMTEETLRQLRQENLEGLMEKDREREAIRSQQIPEQRRQELDEFFDKQDRNEARSKKIRGIARGAMAGAGALAYRAARGTVKAVPRAIAAGTLGAVGLAIGATTGDGEKALGTMAAAGTAGWIGGGSVFESTMGRAYQDTNVREVAGAARYGSKTDYRNEMADKEFLRSGEFNDYYEKYFKGKKSKKEVKEAFKSYREAGITDNNTIRKAMALEDKYAKEMPGIDARENRANVQNIVQTKDVVSPQAYAGNKAARDAEIKRIEGSLTNISSARQRHEVANRIMKGYEDFRAIV